MRPCERTLAALLVALAGCADTDGARTSADSGAEAGSGGSTGNGGRTTIGAGGTTNAGGAGGTTNDGGTGSGGVTAGSGGANAGGGAVLDAGGDARDASAGGTTGSPDAAVDADTGDAAADAQGDAGDGRTPFVNTAPPMLAPITRGPAAQWEYHEIAGTVCRDGTPAGFYTRFSDTRTTLLIYLEQGGACFHDGLCSINPARVADSITGRDLSGAGLGFQPGVMQAPTTTGIFDFTRTENPFRDWNMVWVPYCTGDVHAGSEPNGAIPNLPGVQRFMGYQNMRTFVGHIVPTFSTADRVVLTGTSAGSFGAGLNYNQVQDAFGAVPVTLIMDSGIPFSDAYMAPCLQQLWRQYWNIDAALPPDCVECTTPAGGGMTNLFAFSARKYPNAKVAVISSIDDEIMGLILGAGENDCALQPGFPPGRYLEALNDLRTMGTAEPGHFASYFIPGGIHMYTQFDDFYSPLAAGVPLVDFVNDVLGGTMTEVGP